MFTQYHMVKRNVTESVPDTAPIHTGNIAFSTVFATEQE